MSVRIVSGETRGWSDRHTRTPVAEGSIARSPTRTDSAMSLAGFVLKMTLAGAPPRACAASSPLRPRTATMSLMPEAAMQSRQSRITGRSLSNRSCFGRPILREAPAARSTADTRGCMFSPLLDDLGHDAHGDLFGRDRTDGKAHGNNDPRDIFGGEPRVAEGVHQQAFLPPAAEEADVAGIGPERRLDGVEVMVMAAGRDDDERCRADRYVREDRRIVAHRDIMGVGERVPVREFRAVVRHGHVKAGESGKPGKRLAYVPGAEDDEPWVGEDRLDVDGQRAPAHQAAVLFRKLEGHGPGRSLLHGHPGVLDHLGLDAPAPERSQGRPVVAHQHLGPLLLRR